MATFLARSGHDTDSKGSSSWASCISPSSAETSDCTVLRSCLKVPRRVTPNGCGSRHKFLQPRNCLNMEVPPAEHIGSWFVLASSFYVVGWRRMLIRVAKHFCRNAKNLYRTTVRIVSQPHQKLLVLKHGLVWRTNIKIWKGLINSSVLAEVFVRESAKP